MCIVRSVLTSSHTNILLVIITVNMCSLLKFQSFVKTDPRDIVLGPNATSLLNAVVLSTTYTHHQHPSNSCTEENEGHNSSSPKLNTLLELKPGDHIMLFDTSYGGVKKLCAEACRRSGAILKIVPMPTFALDEMDPVEPVTTASEVDASRSDTAATAATTTATATLATATATSTPRGHRSPTLLPTSAANHSANHIVTDATTDAAATAACVAVVSEHVQASQGRTALVVLDHATSNTALTLPVGAMARAAKEAGAKCVLVDGAHGVWAQVSLKRERKKKKCIFSTQFSF